MPTDLQILEQQPQLFSDPRIRFSARGLELPDGLEYSDWEMVGRTLHLLEQGIQWAIGDWIMYGEHKYGEMYTQAIELTGREYGMLSDYVYVARRYPPSERRENLSWTHHREAARLSPEKRNEILDKAEHDNFTTKEVRREVAQLRRNSDPYSCEITPSFDSGREMFSDYEVLSKVLQWPPEHREIFDAALQNVWFLREGRPEGWEWIDYYIHRKPGDDLQAYKAAIKEIRG